MVIFDEASHTYTNKETGERYISATQLLSEFKNKFDSDKHSQRIADRDGVTKDQVLQLWENEKNKSITKGKNIHRLLENYLKFGETEKDYGWLYKTFEYNRAQIIDSYDKLFSENLLYDHSFKIAGTCDLIYEKGNEFCVVDFKTNKQIRNSNPFKEYLKAPVDFLQNCEYNVYALQLSLYAYMYEKLSNKSVRSLSILHLKDERMTTYNVPYLKLEIKEILKHYSQNYK